MYDEIITVVQVLQEADIVGIVITVVELAVNADMNSIYSKLEITIYVR